MSVGGKKHQLVGDLAELIRSGRLAHGDQLPGEHQLAEKYHVSRGTVRSALVELQHQALISTHAGVGSFVTFDGVPLDQRVGWARAFEDCGAPVTTELLGLTEVEDAELSRRFSAPKLVRVKRLRRDETGRGISLEEATLPAVGPFAELRLVDDSITATQHEAGLHPVGGEQWIAAQPLDAAAARLLGRSTGELFLKATRTSLDADAQLVEHVVSLLDPARFSFHLTFGSR
ncbi:GntR family transcriptional regulator [Amycolatopsis rhabdoformis]|uniref:GntR family transcriptional regulator n=1 Tax=Amycolatopsis rhabdoformis TaxID=1448059 RepID=A0ABZ1I344_9PSEU|nr:GntR family transcriptional regulator [Amycolatopsis rhabdoformis]WSE27983.1 GntR family transcriptional regulator [Amycolatopsis rhabdoformis]